MRKRLCAALLALGLALTLLPVSAAETERLVHKVRDYVSFRDTAGAWCDAYVKTVYETGLMSGMADGAFHPDDVLTNAQILVITARMHSLFHGGDGVLPPAADGAPWYRPALDYCAQYVGTGQDLQFISMDGKANYSLRRALEQNDAELNEPACRYQFVWFLSTALPESALAPINTVAKLPDVNDADVLRFYNAGILTGTDAYGTFDPQGDLTRGQAAAMLARIVDPGQRARFTPETLVLSQALLGLDPETVLLTVDGCEVDAELVSHLLWDQIPVLESESYWEKYEEYAEAYWADREYLGSFQDYLLEKCGIDAPYPSIDWNTPDGAQVLRENMLADVMVLAVLQAHQSEYPLSEEWRIGLEESIRESDGIYLNPYGLYGQCAKWTLTYEYLHRSLAGTYDLSSGDLERVLREQGLLYGQSLEIYRGAKRCCGYGSDEEAKAAAEEVRREMESHLDEPEYIKYLITKYTDGWIYTTPDQLSIAELSPENQRTLERLGSNRVSPVLTEDGRYLVFVKLDPAQDPFIKFQAADDRADTQLESWISDAQVAFTAAFDAIDYGKAAAAYHRIGLVP